TRLGRALGWDGQRRTLVGSARQHHRGDLRHGRGRIQMKHTILFVSGAALLACSAVLAAIGAPAGTPDRFELKALSTDASRATGGDIRLQVSLPAGVKPGDVKVTANGKDVTAAFRSTTPSALVGLVTGLTNGKNAVAASAGKNSASLEVTNYPITGPVFSG